MYNVLIVDDEPIILSGISHLVDWAALDCRIAGCCRNGQEALSMIESSSVDIVITDIKMPVMDGLELVRKASALHPEIVFVILTSLEEFRLVKEAIRYSVSEYMVKTELDPQSLSAVIEKVKVESTRRKALYSSSEGDSEGRQSLEKLVANLVLMRNIDSQLKARMEAKGLTENFCFVNFLVSYPQSTFEKTWSTDDYMRLYEWQKDVIEKILPSVFHDVVPVTSPVSRYCSFIYLIHGVDPSVWSASIARLGERVAKASAMVTSLSPVLVHSTLHSGPDRLEVARGEMEDASTAVYLGKAFDSIESLDLDSLYARVERAIEEKNLHAFQTCIALAKGVVEHRDHRLSQASFTVHALESALRSALTSIGLMDEKMLQDLFSPVPFISSREQVVRLLDDVGQAIGDLLCEVTGTSSSLVIDRARDYITANVEKRISLSDVAEAAGVSASYLSKSFKKVMGRSLVDYVNTLKVDSAKEMMVRGNYMRVSDIALALGYENVYYFSKVFKKVTGESPTDWQKAQQADPGSLQ